jgi:hypothetical protein
MGDQRLAEAEAMFLQFQNHIADLQFGLEDARRNITPGVVQTAQAATNTLGTLAADQLFSYLPAAGYLPLGNNGLDWKTFLGPLAPPTLTCVDGAFLRLILHNSFFEEPIPVTPFDKGAQPGQALIDVYQDQSQPDFVLFARSTTGRMRITVNAQGYQPSTLLVSLGLGQQAPVAISLKQDPTTVVQRAPYVDVENITRPALQKVRFSIVQQLNDFSPALHTTMIQIDPLPPNVANWLNSWKPWLNSQYPDRGIDCSTPTIYINDYYTPPKGSEVPEDPSAYAVFGKSAFPLLINVSYYTTPISVPLAKAGILALTDDIIQALAGIGILYVDQVAGASSRLIADATGQAISFGRYLIIDALNTVDNIDANRLYYEGIDATVDDTAVEEILEQMGLTDDVALANADEGSLGENVKSIGFANRLILQARRAVPPQHWSLESLGGLKEEQIPSLKQIGVSSKGEFAKRAETSEGHNQLESVLQMDPQAIDQLHAKAYQQMTSSSIQLARVRDLILLPNVNAQTATQLAASNIETPDQVAKTDRGRLMEITGLSEEAAEDLQKEAREAQIEGLEVVNLASVSKEVANVLDKIGVKTISHLLERGERGIAEALREVHGERAVHFVSALFDGIRGATR